MSATITSRNGFDPEITDLQRVYFISGKLCSSKRDGSESESVGPSRFGVVSFGYFSERFLLLVEYQH